MSSLRTAGQRARHRARVLLVQALYQHQLAESDARQLKRQFHEDEGYERADGVYFDEMLDGVLADLPALNDLLAEYTVRDPRQMEPVIRAVMWLGLHELRERRDVPRRVVIDEAVDIAKRFAGTDSHRFVNAVLDRASRRLRAEES